VVAQLMWDGGWGPIDWECAASVEWGCGGSVEEGVVAQLIGE
jgi:hypothetical protein